MGETVKQWMKRGVLCKDVKHGKWLFAPDTKTKLKSSHGVGGVCGGFACLFEWAHRQKLTSLSRVALTKTVISTITVKFNCINQTSFCT